ncbi:MAG TPA: metalloregulator ArsR/SmtB family transcription factor [Polyangiaceae bacterium]|jgi:DNA-binding transcriptional ArsR family regulator|nr:metalloregulator ArsR/SmtB family transcription factor [Polyangiaceae bacterium]
MARARTRESERQDERLDAVFGALSDRTRRAMIARLARGPASVGELGEPFAMSLPAISKHVRVLERAGLLHRARQGRAQRCSLEPRPLESAAAFIERNRCFWEDTLEALAGYLEAGDD